MTEPCVHARADGARIAYRLTPGSAPTVVFLGGYSSDMTGLKATRLEEACRARGVAYLRFDYQGHGASSGRFEDGTVGIWAEDARDLIASVTEGPLVLVGSSMGGWTMLLVALAMPERVRGLVGIASAPDFTEDLLAPALDDAQRATLQTDGVVHLPSRYAEEPYAVTRALLDDGREHLLLRDRVALACPARLLHGLADPDVPWQTSLRLCRVLDSEDVRVVFVKGGGHRLSEPADLDLIEAALDEVLRLVARDA